MSIVRDAIVAEVQQRIQDSRDYYDKRDQAKTTTKKNFYGKKLRDNNIILADLLERLEKITKNKESKNDEQ